MSAPERSLAFACATLITVLAGPPSLPGAVGNPWRVVAVVEPASKTPDEGPTAVIRFANGYVLKPNLYGVSVIGQLPTSTGEPFLVVGGASCTDCDSNMNAVFIGQPTSWPKNPKPGPLVLGRVAVFSTYPHRNFEVASKTLWDWSRLFLGRCIPGGRESVVSFEADRREYRAPWSRSVAWAYVDGASLSMHSAEHGEAAAPTLVFAVDAVRKKTCREVRQTTYDEPF